ncbi:hypothetical protein EH31_12350 [Erythrobacter longus]|uniref:UrcA family protein n=1 Tax=Erythrobacter longus TaxID=1044 RepID=A0A074M9I4_ERYLO|nr:UrcA family protein [Erythrobacter longus]KEO89430.1 hypothetical protein EH31_12350 [Erythrobacter longus]
MKTRNFATMATATLALAMTASPAFAGSAEVHTKMVDYADLNLASPAGQKRLEQRIEAAARSVCSVHENRIGTRLRSPELDACLANARAGAKKQVATIMSDQRRGG